MKNFKLFYEKQSQKLYINMVGDVMLSRRVGEYLDKNPEHDLTQEFGDIFNKAKYNICNFEIPITNRNSEVEGKDVIFKGSKLYKSFPFNYLNLSNNHILDYKEGGLDDTLKFLASKKLNVFGHSNKEAYTIAGDVAIAGYSFKGFDSSYPVQYDEFEDFPSVFSKEKFLKDMREIKAGGVKFIIVNCHWGIEYKTVPEELQKELGKFMIDSGVNVVCGHHPHVQQSIELYKNGLICYSLGNFIFDQTKPGTQIGKIIQLEIDENSWNFSFNEIDTFCDTVNFSVRAFTKRGKTK